MKSKLAYQNRSRELDLMTSRCIEKKALHEERLEKCTYQISEGVNIVQGIRHGEV
jgi:hypothetical protein